MARGSSVALHHHAARLVERRAERLRERRRRDAGGPEDRARSSRCSPSVTPCASTPVTIVFVRTSTPSRSSCVAAFADSSSGNALKHARQALDEHDLRLARIDRPEVVLERMA
jgi:hypothetical protein